MKTGNYLQLEKCFVVVFKQQLALGRPISGRLLKEKGNISKVTTDVVPGVDAADAFSSKFQELMLEERLTRDQVYNTDETGLRWRAIPTTTYLDPKRIWRLVQQWICTICSRYLKSIDVEEKTILLLDNAPSHVKFHIECNTYHGKGSKSDVFFFRLIRLQWSNQWIRECLIF